MNREEFTVDGLDGKTIRADRYVATLGMFSRSQIAQRSVRITGIDGRELKFSKRLQDGDTVTVEWEDPPASDILPEPVDMKILYEDEDCVVIDKQQGLVVHPAHGHIHGTLVQGLLHRYAGLDGQFQGDRVRPGIVHRLDKDTSGILIAARNPEALEYLAAQFRERTVTKLYLAVSRGIPESTEGLIDRPVGRDPRDRKKFNVGGPSGRDSRTRYRVLARSGNYALLALHLLTGRTHQIRVHLKSISCPILGDPLYGRNDPEFPDIPMMLHSWKLTIDLPGHRGTRSFQTDVPRRFLDVMEQLLISGTTLNTSWPNHH